MFGNELKKLKEENEELRTRLCNGFGISDKEQKLIDKWINIHIAEKHNGNSYCGAIGGRFTYEFAPTSIGTIGTIKCACGEEFTFQDL